MARRSKGKAELTVAMPQGQDPLRTWSLHDTGSPASRGRMHTALSDARLPGPIYAGRDPATCDTVSAGF
jgi:hypothetical protein